MSANPLVSIIIPVFNAEKHLDETITSAINQTWKNKEIIIIDDGSTDSSYDIAKNYESVNLKVLTQKNKGASAARNYGFNYSKGEFIQFLDADDLLSENKIEEQLTGLINYPSYFGVCDTVYFKDGQNPLTIEPTITWYSQSFNNNIDFLMNLYGGELVGPNLGGMIQPNCWLAPRKILELAGNWNEDLSVDDDGEFFCRVLLQAKGIYYNPKSLNYYRKHKNAQNLSAQLTYKGYKSMLLATQLKYDHLKSIIEVELLNKIFIKHYEQITIATYPNFQDISKKSFHIAKCLGLKKIQYKGGPISTLLGKIIGWKIVRKVNYLRYGF